MAYSSLLQDRRKVLHERTAQAIEALFRGRLDEHYSELAHHYSRSDNTEKAVEYLGLAGEQAVRRSANAEAISHLTKGLELLEILPDTPERTRQELTLQLILGPTLMATKGWAAPEVLQAYARAQELCQQVGDTPQTFQVLRGLWYFYLLRAELQTAWELGEQLLTLAQHFGDPDLLLEAHYILGTTAVHLGELVPARASLEQVIALHNPQRPRSHARRYGEESGVTAQALISRALWLLGYPDQALRRSHEAVRLTQELGHPFSLAFTLGFASLVHQFRRERQAAQERAEAVITLSDEQGFSQWEALGRVLYGWALTAQGQGEKGIAQMRQGDDAWQATGAELDRSYTLVLLAEAHGNVGQVKEGLGLLAEASAVVDKGDRYWEAEMYRLAGELSLRMGERESGRAGDEKALPHSPILPFSHSSPEECFWKAVEIARRQQAKSLELRATMSLVRLRQQQATQYASRNTQHEARAMLDAARNMLSEIYGWFTEGFDTKDLQEAKALLEELQVPRARKQEKRKGQKGKGGKG
jgi:predicted ATPase